MPNLTLSNKAHLKEFLERFNRDKIILDIGSGGRNLSPHIITVDKSFETKPKVLADIHELPFKDECIDCIICNGTFEHIKNPWKASDEFYRIFKKGGFVYVSIPFMQGYHPDPEDYWRFTDKGLEEIFFRFRKIDSGVLIGSGSGLYWGIVDFLRAFSDRKLISELLGILGRLLFVWIKYFDVILKKKINNKYFASGFFYIGMKP